MSQEVFNPVFHGSLALLAGNLLGSSVDTLIKILKDRANLTETLDVKESTKKILDNSISILFHVGAIGLGTHFISTAFPWLTEETTAFTLWILGVTMSSDTLRQNIKDLNESLSIDPSSPPK